MLSLIIILGLLNTTLLICFKKWKWLDRYEVYRPKFFPSANCYLCLGFWLAVLETIYFLITIDATLVVVPFCSAAITNYLTNTAIIHAYSSNR